LSVRPAVMSLNTTNRVQSMEFTLRDRFANGDEDILKITLVDCFAVYFMT
jgi:hypothetical protein